MGFGAFALAPAMRNQMMYGTVSTDGTPPLIRYCGRTYVPASASKWGRPMDLYRADRIGTTPSGMPVVTSVLSPASQAYSHTQVCTMAVWVETGSDQYLAYVLSGGP